MLFLMRKWFKILLLLSISLCLSGCAQVARDPSVPIGLLTKSRELLVFCIFLLDSSKNYYNQIATRYYYSMFSIAKLISLWKHNKSEYSFEKQDAVWSVQKHFPKKIYGDQLKRLRVECDYMPNFNEDEFEHFHAELISIINDERPFNELISDAKEIVEKYYSDEDKDLREQCISILEEIVCQKEEIKRKVSITD